MKKPVTFQDVLREFHKGREGSQPLIRETNLTDRIHNPHRLTPGNNNPPPKEPPVQRTNSQHFENARIPGWLIAIVLILLFLVVTSIGGCFALDRVKTEAGTETVVTDTPMFFGKGGVRPETLKPGAEWIWSTTKRDVVEPKPVMIPVAIDDFVSEDNILLDFDASVTVQVTDWPKMMSLYGTAWWKNNLERPYQAMVREQVKQKSMKAMMSDIAAAKEVDDNLTKGLTDKVKELNLPVRILEISLGKAKPNAKILEQMNETAAQQQRLLTLEQARLAEVKRKEEQGAKAEADNEYRNKIGLNAEEFVKLQMADKLIAACREAKECVLVPPGTNVVR